MRGLKKTLLLAYRKSSLRSGRLGVSSPRCSSCECLQDFICTHIYQEGLGADVRIETERKLKSLEADLVVAERANKERALATRYHKVKFFGAYYTLYLLGAFSKED